MKKIVTVITMVNTRTSEEFKSILNVSEIEKNGKTTKVYTLGKEDGTTKEVAESTFNRYYKNVSKQVEVDVEEPSENSDRKPNLDELIDSERTNLRTDEAEKTVWVRAFTGMLIGIFKVEEETPTTVTVKTAKGKLEFDRETGIQTNSNNKRFANRIEV